MDRRPAATWTGRTHQRRIGPSSSVRSRLARPRSFRNMRRAGCERTGMISMLPRRSGWATHMNPNGGRSRPPLGRRRLTLNGIAASRVKFHMYARTARGLRPSDVACTFTYGKPVLTRRAQASGPGYAAVMPLETSRGPWTGIGLAQWCHRRRCPRPPTPPGNVTAGVAPPSRAPIRWARDAVCP
jgi:hypothetical protein